MATMPPRYPPIDLVDTALARSLDSGRPTARPSTLRDRPPIAVGPGRSTAIVAPRSGYLRDQGTTFPIQLAKVQRPALREETLERPRLLDWLRAKIHGRVVLLLADAGYGKTTLLADFSRRTRLRTLWYRLDETDRDWTSFLRHLVAAGREHDPEFAPATTSLLAEIGVGGPSREAVLDTFIRELPTIAVGGAILVFDDFHLVDDATDVRHIARELLARAPERLTIVFASRRAPTVQLSRLRAVGEVAELTTDDLRFDAAETAQLFTETFGRQLDPDILLDLARRTEGWIASLQLVQAALRDRSPAEIRRFVRTLNGADHEMYDYLAEEVVGDLSQELQRFLMDTSVLQVVTPELAEVVSGQDAAGVTRLTAAAERLTLLSRMSGAPRTHQRYHPLVREFLEGRFRSMDGDEVVAGLHRRVAAATAATDWRVAAHHYREAGDTAAMLNLINEAIPTIMGNGQYALAETFVTQVPPEDRPPGFDLILSRIEMQRGDYDAAIAASQAVLDATDDPIQRDYALLNLLTLALNLGDHHGAASRAASLLASTTDPNLWMIGDVSMSILAAATDGDIDVVNRKLRAMAAAQQETHRHQYGVTMLNLASNSWVQGRPDDALAEVRLAIDALGATSASFELSSALVLRLTVLAATGRWSEYELRAKEYESSETPRRDPDAVIEMADLLDSYASPDQFWPVIGAVTADTVGPSFRNLLLGTIARGLVRRRRFDEAAQALAEHTVEPGTFTASVTTLLFTRAYLATASGAPGALTTALAAKQNAAAQNAHRLRRLAELLIAFASGSETLERVLAAELRAAPWNVTYLSDLVVNRLDELNEETAAEVRSVAQRYSSRWKVAARTALDATDAPSSPSRVARLLEGIGDRSDVPRLRRIAKQRRRSSTDSSLGRALARRVADRIFIEDQGRVSITVGPRSIPGSEIRRKVLGLVCLLVSRPEMSATRDQILDSLWPDLEPAVAVNSLNQTIYFLRRVFEEEYSDDLSPGYVHHDSEVIWLDPELVTARSVECRVLIRDLSRPASPAEVEALVSMYQGRFALDFEYEEWAAAYRDTLHASYLEVVERAVLDDLTYGHFDRGIAVARRALEVDSTAEQVEVSLLRLYKASGAHSAAAEQYAHYASVQRDELGLEPPPLDSL